MRIKILLILLLLTSPVSAQRQARPMMEYPTPYYIIHTDLTGDQLREAELRMTRMAEEYHARTHQFAGDIHSKLPFFLFTREQDYYDAGGATGTAGEFDPANNRLMAIADLGADGYPWHVIQHEGFHQFAHAVIGGELPIWVNEGMAEYFGEGLFTGDGFVMGVVPPERLARIKQAMEDKQFRPIKEMMLLAHKDWNDEMSLTNYDQAWSMVQFLAHGENGKYQGAFVNFMRAIGRGQQWTPAWIASFGSAEGFEEKWQAYWRDLPEDSTLDLYARATTATLTSVLARATAQRQKFASMEEMESAAKKGALKIDPRDWLPASLIQDAFADAAKMKTKNVTFALVPGVGTRLPVIVCTIASGASGKSDAKKLTGRFKLNGTRVGAVTVDMPDASNTRG